MILDHVNIRTNNLDSMVTFFEQVAGLGIGARPPFKSLGVWMYDEADKPVVHLVAITEPQAPTTGSIDHVAFRGEDVNTARDRLKRYGHQYSERVVPVTGQVQLFVDGPDGIRVELQFDT